MDIKEIRDKARNDCYIALREARKSCDTRYALIQYAESFARRALELERTIKVHEKDLEDANDK